MQIVLLVAGELVRCLILNGLSPLWAVEVKTRENRTENISERTGSKMEDIGEFSDPVLMSFSEGSPRLVDTVFNVSSLTSGIFNNTLFQYAGVVILGIILFGKCDHTSQSRTNNWY